MNRRPSLCVLSALLFAGLTYAQSADLGRILAGLPGFPRNGFALPIAGETIKYHSVNENAREALLVRATDGRRSIEWATAPVAAPVPRGRIAFAWLAALSGSKGVHRFNVEVNGKPMFTFSSLEDSTSKTFTEHGESGAELTFCGTEADRFQDLMGYMFMVLPSSMLAPGAAVRVRVQGEAAGSDAWFMTFEHPLKDTAIVRPYPALLRWHGREMQPVSVAIERYSGVMSAKIRIEGGATEEYRLHWGANDFLLPQPPVSAPQRRTLSVRAGGTVLASGSLLLQPVQKRTLYLLPHSHTDIGYSAYQADVEKSHMRYIDQAMAIAEQTSGYPPEARFKWNIEVMWPLESYLSSASAEQKSRFGRALGKGWICANGLYANLLTGLCRPEELFHATDYARHITSEFGVAVTSAMISDIPAYSSSIVTALSRGGIRYLSSGPNYVSTFPDGGDRIGAALRTWGDKPFYWVSASGQDTVLFWMAGRGYSWFHGLNMGELASAKPSELFRYIGELDEQRYPYAMVQVRYTIGGDNGPPDPRLPDAVRRWNEQYISPRFVIATSKEMFEEFERMYGRSLPVFSGDLTPIWEDGAASTARELAENRQTAEQLTQTEAMYAMLRPAAFRATESYGAWRGIVLFDEHTWGASNSISEPDSPNVRAQWEYKLDFLRSAEHRAGEMRSSLVGAFPRGPVTSVDIINTASWPRTDIVIVPDSVVTAGIRAHDESGLPVPAQRLISGDLALLVHDVPPLGLSRVFFEPGDPFIPADPPSVSGATIRNGEISVTIDPHTGVISSLRNGTAEFADTAAGAGLNRYLYVAGRNPKKAATDTSVSVSLWEKGPLVASFHVESRPPGCRSLWREVRVIAGLPRVDIIDNLLKLRVREKESVHFAFPFLVPGGTLRIDNGWSIVRAEADQLAGACRDYFTVQRWVDVSNGERGVTLALPDAPLVEPGAMTDETLNASGVRSWKGRVDRGSTLYSYIMNNYWHTNYKADQEGEATFRYSIMPHARFDPVLAELFGTGQSQPLVAIPVQPDARPGSSLLTMEPSQVVATSFKPAADGRGWILHLSNAGPSPASLRLSWHGASPARFFRSDLNEMRDGKATFPLTIVPSGISMLRIETGP